MLKASLALLCRRILTSYWFIPVVMAMFGLVLPYLTAGFNAGLDEHALLKSLAWLDMSDRQAAGQLMTAMISSIINVISITFSLTMVVLTLAASQYGPQVLRNFMEDWTTKVVLGTFVATFIYCLLTLRILGSQDPVSEVPDLTVALALILMILCVCVLIIFIHHVAQCIQVDCIIKQLSVELLEAIDRQYPEDDEAGGDKHKGGDARAASGDGPSVPDGDFVAINAPVGGYIQSIATGELPALARQFDSVIRQQTQVGDFVVPGAELARVYPGTSMTAAQCNEINRQFVIGARRTPVQDIRYTIEKIDEIALRALSPGVNEPFVAIKCLDYLSLALTVLAGRHMPSPCGLDDRGDMRLISPVLSFEQLLRNSLDPLVHYSGEDDKVMEQIVRVVRRIMTCNENPGISPVLNNYMAQLRQVIEDRHWDPGKADRLLHASNGDG